MSETIKDGGPAFPLDNWDTIKWPAGTPSDFGVGMTLRDWFAGQAIMAAFTSRHVGEYEGDTQDIANCAFQLADAMLKAREVAK